MCPSILRVSEWPSPWLPAQKAGQRISARHGSCHLPPGSGAGWAGSLPAFPSHPRAAAAAGGFSSPSLISPPLSPRGPLGGAGQGPCPVPCAPGLSSAASPGRWQGLRAPPGSVHRELCRAGWLAAGLQCTSCKIPLYAETYKSALAQSLWMRLRLWTYLLGGFS